MCPAQCLPRWSLLCAKFAPAMGFECLGEWSRPEYFVAGVVAFAVAVAAGEEEGV